MADLGWIKEGKSKGQVVIPFQTNVHMGSEIRVRGRHYGSGPTPEFFEVFRGYGRLGRKYLAKRGRPTETLMVGLGLDATESTKEVAISEPFPVWVPRGRLRVPMFARDSVGTRTNPDPIFAARLGGINVKPDIKVRDIGGSVISAELTTAIDPEFDLSVLLPWQSGDNRTVSGDNGTVQDVIRDIAGDLAESTDVDYESAIAWLFEEVGWALPSDPLSGWSVQLSDRTMALADGQTAAISILFITPTPGAVAFAIQARGDVPDYDAATVASEIFALEVGPDLEEVSLTPL